MKNSNVKEMAQALEAEFREIPLVADFMEAKEQVMKTLAEANEKLDQACASEPLYANESEFRHIVDIFEAIIETPYEQFKLPESRNAFQRIFGTAKVMLEELNKQWKGTP